MIVTGVLFINEYNAHRSGPQYRPACTECFMERYILFIKLVFLGLVSPEPALKGLDERTTFISATNQLYWSAVPELSY